jgi:hypothetical protein
VFDSAVPDSTPFPKGPSKSSVGGTPGWSSSSARWYGWPPPGVDLSVRRDFRPGRSSASRGSGVSKLPFGRGVEKAGERTDSRVSGFSLLK